MRELLLTLSLCVNCVGEKENRNSAAAVSADSRTYGDAELGVSPVLYTLPYVLIHRPNRSICAWLNGYADSEIDFFVQLAHRNLETEENASIAVLARRCMVVFSRPRFDLYFLVCRVLSAIQRTRIRMYNRTYLNWMNCSRLDTSIESLPRLELLLQFFVGSFVSLHVTFNQPPVMIKVFRPSKYGKYKG